MMLENKVKTIADKKEVITRAKMLNKEAKTKTVMGALAGNSKDISILEKEKNQIINKF